MGLTHLRVASEMVAADRLETPRGDRSEAVTLRVVVASLQEEAVFPAVEAEALVGPAAGAVVALRRMIVRFCTNC